jgi:hypothetical protein
MKPKHIFEQVRQLRIRVNTFPVMQQREHLDVQGQGQHGPGAFAEHGRGHVVRLRQERIASGHLGPRQVFNPSEQSLMFEFLVAKAHQALQSDLVPQPMLTTEF